VATIIQVGLVAQGMKAHEAEDVAANNYTSFLKREWGYSYMLLSI